MQMMQFKKIFWIILVSLLGFGHSSAQSSTAFAWLEGTWKNRNRAAYEVWTKGKGDVLFHGLSYKISAKSDTVITEEIKFIREGEKFLYIPDVAGDQGPIRFIVTDFSSNGFVAENPAHDFPKKIIYRYFKDENQLKATISGNGKSIDFNFEKIK